jgi:hypothetical protein
MTLSGFPSGASGGTQAFTLTIPFDSPRLSFLGIKSPVPAGLVISQASGTLVLSWTDPTGPSINGNFLTLKFKYNGIGTAHVAFGNGCVFNTNTAGVIGTVQVAYTNATITPATATANANVGFVQAAVGANVLVPVNFSLLPVNMGAVTLYLTYDYNKLTFINAQNYPTGTVWNLNPSTHIISITWNGTSGTNINGTFLNLYFTYNGGGDGCGAAVSFTDGCQLADYPTANIVQCNWINGGVDLRWTISGTLLYNNDANTPLAGATIYIKDGPQPVPPAVGPIPNVLYTTTTDVNGNFSVDVPNGSYYLYASTALAWGGVGQPDVTNLRRYIANFSNSISGNPLRIRAADINQDGIVDNSDVTPLRRRIAGLSTNPNYLAPDWMFQNPIVLINCANLPATNILGICSGDVNGSYPDPNAK